MGDKLSKRRLWVLALAGLVLLLLIFGGDIEEFIASDSCLDSGGRWLYAEERCDFGTQEDCRQAEGIWQSERQRCNVRPRSNSPLTKSRMHDSLPARFERGTCRWRWGVRQSVKVI